MEDLAEWADRYLHRSTTESHLKQYEGRERNTAIPGGKPDTDMPHEAVRQSGVARARTDLRSAISATPLS